MEGGDGTDGPTESPTGTDTPGEPTTEAPGETPDETTTDAPNETTTETPTETPTEPPENASVVFDDQTSDGRQVVVNETNLPEAGEVRIRDSGGNVLGSTELPAGRSTNVPVQVDPPLTQNETLTAELYDSGGNALRNASGDPAVDGADVTVPVQGATRAPDLTDVSNFQFGETSDGRAATTADFTFDQPVDVVGGAGNFNLIPRNNSGDPTALDGVGEIKEVDGNTVTVAFIDDRSDPEGPVDPADISRGFVDANTVQPQGVTDGSTNPLQAEPVNYGGVTESPDIESIQRNVLNNSLVFTFDEPVSPSDTSGFNYYTQEGEESSGVGNVRQVDNRTLEVQFTLDNPVSNAVGGSAEANAVVGNGPGEDTNLPDEQLVSGDTSSSGSMGGLAFAGFGFAGLAAASMLMIRRQRR